MSSTDDQDIKQLLNSSADEPPTETTVSRALKRARAGVAQRDTLAFAIVRIWTSLAALLAPLFAAFASSHAQARHGRQKRQNEPPNRDS